MSTYGWIITRDLIDGSEAGVMGPRDIHPNVAAHLKTCTHGLRFRLLDDDDEPYYEGLLIAAGAGTVDDLTEEQAFAPLTDFGGPGSGCTMIEYRVAGKWVTL